MSNKARQLQKTLEAIVRDDSRYAIGAYIFVRMAFLLCFTFFCLWG